MSASVRVFEYLVNKKRVQTIFMHSQIKYLLPIAFIYYKSLCDDDLMLVLIEVYLNLL